MRPPTPRILVVEDDAALRANLLDLLEAEGMLGLAAATGEQGHALAIQELPDLILCDVTMGDLDGFTLCQRLRDRPDTARIPFIFLSARVEPDDVARGSCLGAGYLTKPFTRDAVLQRIESTLP